MANRVHVYLDMLMLHIPSVVKSRAENPNGRADGVEQEEHLHLYTACVCETERLISGREPIIAAILNIAPPTHTHLLILQT